MIEPKKERRVLYVRIGVDNLDWIQSTMKKLGHTSKSQFVDLLISDTRKKQSDRKQR